MRDHRINGGAFREERHDRTESPRTAHRRRCSVGCHRAHAVRKFAAARRGAPLGKQNPGWYRYKVGNFEVTAVTDGAQHQSAARHLRGATSRRPTVNAALEADFLPKDKVIRAYTPVVVNTGSKLVAIDTGLGLGMFAQSKGAVGQYHSNLQAAGIDRNAIDVVIISHFHGDHINGLVGPENKPAFPNAEIIVPEAEWAFWIRREQHQQAA